MLRSLSVHAVRTLALLALASATNSQQPAFGPATQVAAGTNPTSTVVADFDGDGNLDAAACHRSSNDVHVWRGDGSGALQPTGVHPVDLGLRRVRAADMDVDGNLDLVFACGANGNIAVLLGDGAFGFGAASLFDVGDAGGTQDVDVGDFDLDGIPDVASPMFWKDGVSVQLGVGGGALGSPTILSAGDQPGAITVADLDRDGNPDLVVSNSASQAIGIFLGVGDGSFGSQTLQGVGAIPTDLAVADVDGDGNEDVITLAGGAVVLLGGDGSGGLSVSSSFQVPNLFSPLLADWDLDGTMDLAVTVGAQPSVVPGSVAVFRGLAGGTFEFQSGHPRGLIGFTDRGDSGDLDGDGRPDLVLSDYWGDTISVLLSSQAGVPQPPCLQASSPTATSPQPWWTAICEVNGDGVADLAVGTGDDVASASVVEILIGDGAGGFTSAGAHTVGGLPNSVAAADLDGDGDQDLATANLWGSSVSLLLGDGLGGFAAGATLTGGSGQYTVRIADLDGDGLLDILTANESSNDASVWIASGPAAYAASVQVPVGSRPNGARLADLDLDGDLDAIFANRDGNDVAVLLGDGAGGFTHGGFQAVGLRPIGLDVGDLDGDGVPDAAVGNIDSDAVYVLFGDGWAGFSTVLVLPVTGDAPESVGIGDLQGDGCLDIVVGNGQSDDVSIFVGSGGGAFASELRQAVGDRPHGLEVGDLDGNGLADVVASNIQSNDVSIVLSMPCPPTIASVSPTSAQFPGPVTVSGVYLDTITSATVQGFPVGILSQSFGTLLLQPVPCDPGFAALDLIGPGGSDTHKLELWPTLQATTTGVGGVVDVELDLGTEGRFMLAMGTVLFPFPLPLVSPPSWYGLLLDPSAPFAFVDAGVVPSPGLLSRSYPVPPNPALPGNSLHLQAWTVEGPFGLLPSSFTNVATIDFP